MIMNRQTLIIKTKILFNYTHNDNENINYMILFIEWDI